MVSKKKFTIYFNKHRVKTIEEECDDLTLGNDFPPKTSKFIADYIENTLHFKSYYWNCCMPDEHTLHIDYGSHVNFINVVQEEVE